MTNDTTTNGDLSRDHHFLVGFILGGAVGAGLAMLLAPRVAAELRQRVTDSARTLGRAASERQQQASARIGDAVDDLTKKGQGVRDDVLEAVASGARMGAQKVERFAADHSTANRPTS
jgi:gas vesicle protein